MDICKMILALENREEFWDQKATAASPCPHSNMVRLFVSLGCLILHPLEILWEMLQSAHLLERREESCHICHLGNNFKHDQRKLC